MITPDELTFVRIFESLHKPINLVTLITEETGYQVVGKEVVSSLPTDTIQRMNSLQDGYRIIIRNISTAEDSLLKRLDLKGCVAKLFPFCALHRHGGAVSVITPDDAIRSGNYLLCYKKKPVTKKKTTQTKAWKFDHRSNYTSPSCGEEFSCSLDLHNDFPFRTNYPAYVNLDRDSDNIGGSSWDGNLVSWFGAGFTSRVRFAEQSGMFNE